jgi:hypothetical protein
MDSQDIRRIKENVGKLARHDPVIHFHPYSDDSSARMEEYSDGEWVRLADVMQAIEG